MSRSVFIHPFTACSGDQMSLNLVFCLNHEKPFVRFKTTKKWAYVSLYHIYREMAFDGLGRLASSNSMPPTSVFSCMHKPIIVQVEYIRPEISLVFLTAVPSTPITWKNISRSNNVRSEIFLNSKEGGLWFFSNNNYRYLTPFKSATDKALLCKRVRKYYPIGLSFLAYKWTAKIECRICFICLVPIIARK